MQKFHFKYKLIGVLPSCTSIYSRTPWTVYLEESQSWSCCATFHDLSDRGDGCFFMIQELVFSSSPLYWNRGIIWAETFEAYQFPSHPDMEFEFWQLAFCAWSSVKAKAKDDRLVFLHINRWKGVFWSWNCIGGHDTCTVKRTLLVKCFRKDCGSPETSRAIPALCAIWILSCIQFQIFSPCFFHSFCHHSNVLYCKIMYSSIFGSCIIKAARLE